MRTESITSRNLLVSMCRLKFLVIHHNGECTARQLTIYHDHHLPIWKFLNQRLYLVFFPIRPRYGIISLNHGRFQILIIIQRQQPQLYIFYFHKSFFIKKKDEQFSAHPYINYAILYQKVLL